MDVFVLDSLLRRTEVIDLYESFIWTERRRDNGDFELVLPDTRTARSLLIEGTRLVINNSKRVMTVENLEKTETENGRMLKVTGPSLEDILSLRVARRVLSSGTAEPTWNLEGLPAQVIRAIFDRVCRVGGLDSRDVIPFITSGSIYPASTIPEPNDYIKVQIPPGNLYNVIKDMCDAYDLGFRLVRAGDTSRLYFDIYTGNDRTTQQTNFTPVIFDPKLETLQGTTEFNTIQPFRNVAYVIAPNGYRVVLNALTEIPTEGFDRRVMYVDASDITLPAGSALQDALLQRGKEELAKNRPGAYLDGEQLANSPYVYGVDYELGDIVEMRNADGVTAFMRVTEQIFVSDINGDRSYPTLVSREFIERDVWFGSNYANMVWDDAPGTWEDLMVTPDGWLAPEFDIAWEDATRVWD